MADPAFVSASTGVNNSAATTHNVTLPATLLAGQRVVAFLSIRLAPTIVSYSDGWDEVGAPAVEDVGQVTLLTLSKIATDDDVGATLQVETDTAQRSAWIVFVLSNASTIEAATPRTDQGITSAPNPPAIALSGSVPTLFLTAFATRDGQAVGITNVTGPANYNGNKRYTQTSNSSNGVAVGASYRAIVTASSEDPSAWGLDLTRRALAQTYAVRNTLQTIVAPLTPSAEQTFAAALSYQIAAPFTPSAEQTFAGNLIYDQTIVAPFTASAEQTFDGNIVTAEIGAPFTPSAEQTFGATIVAGVTTIEAPFTPSAERTFRPTVTGGDRTTPLFSSLSIGPISGALGDLALYSGASQGASFATRWNKRGAVGFTDFATFDAGEYEFSEALVWLNLNVEAVERTFAITRAKLNVDVPDVIDSGEIDIPIGGQRVEFARFFYQIPKVVANFVAGSGLTTVPRATVRADVDREGFYVTVHYGDDVTNSVAGRVHWVAQGY